MSQKIQAQATKFWQSVVSADTIGAYAKAIDVTWTIIKEAAILIWLIICLVLVIFDWGYDVSTKAGQNTRAWWDGMSKTDSNDIAAETGKQLLAASKASLTSTISQARGQLGLPNKPKATPAIAPTTEHTQSSPSSPATAPKATAPAAPKVAPTSSSES